MRASRQQMYLIVTEKERQRIPRIGDAPRFVVAVPLCLQQVAEEIARQICNARDLYRGSLQGIRTPAQQASDPVHAQACARASG
jgi:hypothetical protein